ERLTGVTNVVVQDHLLRMHVNGPIAPVVKTAARYELADFVSREPSLEETFLAEYGHEKVEVAGNGPSDRSSLPGPLPSRGPAAAARLRLRPHLRQDAARLTAGVPRRLRHPRRDHALRGRGRGRPRRRVGVGAARPGPARPPAGRVLAGAAGPG